MLSETFPEQVLEWLIQNQSSADDVDVVESVGEEELEIMIENVDQMMVLFLDTTKLSTRSKSRKVISSYFNVNGIFFILGFLIFWKLSMMTVIEWM